MPRIRFSHKPPSSGGSNDNDKEDRIKFYLTIDLSIPFTMKEKVAIVIILGSSWLFADTLKQKTLSFLSQVKEAVVNLLF
jgi:hypothetical protein